MFYMGTIDVASGAIKDNGNCTTTFTIPKGAKELVIQPDIAGMFFALNRQSAQTPAASELAEMNTAKERIRIVLPDVDSVLFVVVRNPTAGAGNVKVFRVR